MKDIRILFGTRVKELRKNARYSQDQLAERVNISSKYLSRIEMGEHFPSLDVLAKLAENLEVEIKDLFEFYHEAPTPKELKEGINNLIKSADEEKLRILLKLVRAVLK